MNYITFNKDDKLQVCPHITINAEKTKGDPDSEYESTMAIYCLVCNQTYIFEVWF